MALKIIEGDLLQSNCDIIAHQANCKSTMNSGVARVLREKYPEVYIVDKESDMSEEEKFGRVTYVGTWDDRIVFNLYGQKDYGRGKKQTSYKHLEMALREMFEIIDEKYNDRKTIGIPYLMSSDLAGGDWRIVSAMIYALSEEYKREVYCYALNKTKPSVMNPLNGEWDYSIRNESPNWRRAKKGDVMEVEGIKGEVYLVDTEFGYGRVWATRIEGEVFTGAFWSGFSIDKAKVTKIKHT